VFFVPVGARGVFLLINETFSLLFFDPSFSDSSRWGGEVLGGGGGLYFPEVPWSSRHRERQRR
jgi:hypothetical protein